MQQQDASETRDSSDALAATGFEVDDEGILAAAAEDTAIPAKIHLDWLERALTHQYNPPSMKSSKTHIRVRMANPCPRILDLVII